MTSLEEAVVRIIEPAALEIVAEAKNSGAAVPAIANAVFVDALATARRILALHKIVNAVEALKPFADSYANGVPDGHPALWNFGNGKHVITANYGDLRRAREAYLALTAATEEKEEK